MMTALIFGIVCVAFFGVFGASIGLYLMLGSREFSIKNGQFMMGLVVLIPCLIVTIVAIGASFLLLP